MASQKRNIVVFALLGLLVPLAYIVASLVSPDKANAIFWVRHMEELLILVWPGSLVLIGSSEETSYVPCVLSVISNIIYYGFIATAFFLIRKFIMRRNE